MYIDHSSTKKFKSIKNRIFIREEIKKYDYVFSNVNGYSLDTEQRIAIVTDEINTLIVAGAGSGKSLTMIGKIRYLIEKDIKEDEILCITFTKEAAKNLENNIKKNYNYDIKVYTFHSLSYNILRKYNYSVVTDDYLEYLIDEYFNCIIYNNKEMIKKAKRVFGKVDTPYKELLKTREYTNLKRLIITFINLFKTNDYDISYFLKMKSKDIISIIIDIYFLYEQELGSTNTIDYNDMIMRATKEVSNLKYKYIIVDEFQDTSYIRYKLLKSIINQTNAKLICVGDDYQSIYRFSGCDINMFINFKKYFGYTKVLKISNTYRNSQELINVAGSFIMKNKKQIYKKLRSNKHIYKPIIISYKNIYYLLNKLVNKYNSILILGRNNADINIFKEKEFLYKGCRIRCMTIHSSKGLEDECVVLLNVIDDPLGIPSKIENVGILNYVSMASTYPYDEERRLFYVGLTRTKNEVYILTKKNNESIFVKELKRDFCKYIGHI